MIKRFWYYILILIGLGLMGYSVLTVAEIKEKTATTKVVNQALQDLPRNATLFLSTNKLPAIDFNAVRSNLSQQFLHYYFSPWDQPFLFMSSADMKAMEITAIRGFRSDPGWLENRQRNSVAAIDRIDQNMNLSDFPNLKVRAITVRNTNLRILPTNKPLFGDWHQAGQGYPFDNLQNALLAANLPVYVLQVSRDGAWDLVSTPDDSIGWVNSLDLAEVNQAFITHWRQTQHYVIAHKDRMSLFDSHQRFYLLSRVGELFPWIADSSQSYKVMTAVRDTTGAARTEVVNISKAGSTIFPMPAQPVNVVSMINQMLRMPYGWGELYGYRDCSATTKDIFSVFGIWLPRNSSDQARIGHFINLSGLSNEQKADLLLRQGVPLYTLLSMPGHIMLYLGQYQHQLWIFHNPWGVHTISPSSGKQGRAVIGRAVITPLNFGDSYVNVKKDYLQNITGMTILAPIAQVKINN